jgi:hypothetical protein
MCLPILRDEAAKVWGPGGPQATLEVKNSPSATLDAYLGGDALTERGSHEYYVRKISAQQDIEVSARRASEWAR